MVGEVDCRLGSCTCWYGVPLLKFHMMTLMWVCQQNLMSKGMLIATDALLKVFLLTQILAKGKATS